MRVHQHWLTSTQILQCICIFLTSHSVLPLVGCHLSRRQLVIHCFFRSTSAGNANNR